MTAPTFHRNPLTDAQRAAIQHVWRGRPTSPGMVRDFCVGCGLPTEIPAGETLEQWECEDCKPAMVLETGGDDAA